MDEKKSVLEYTIEEVKLLIAEKYTDDIAQKFEGKQFLFQFHSDSFYKLPASTLLACFYFYAITLYSSKAVALTTMCSI